MGLTKQRVFTAIPLAMLALVAVWMAPQPLLLMLFAVLSLLCAWELGGLVQFDRWQGTAFVALLLAAIVLLWRYPLPTDSWAIPGFLWWLMLALWVIAQARRSVLFAPRRWVRALAGWLTLVLAWVSLSYLLAAGPSGAFWLTLLFALVWGADIGGYFAGRRFGRHLLAPGISPGKTWEGLVGGLVLGSLAATGVHLSAMMLGLILPSLLWLLPVSVMVILFSVAGDLTESLLKRQVNAKDSGRLLPGHGGLLDRVDALLAAAPVLALAVARLP